MYKVEKLKIKKLLTSIIELKGVKNTNKGLLIAALEIFNSRNMDIVDALLSAYKNENYLVLNFDKDITKYKPAKN